MHRGRLRMMTVPTAVAVGLMTLGGAGTPLAAGAAAGEQDRLSRVVDTVHYYVGGGLGGGLSGTLDGLAGGTSAAPAAAPRQASVTANPMTANPAAAKPAAVTTDPYLFKETLAWKAYSAATDPAVRRDFYNIAATPTSLWLGGRDQDAELVARVSRAAAAQDKVPQFVFYAIPGRDCGGYSAGGATSDAAYRAWIDDVVAAIGSRPAIVTVEPDAISFCGNDAGVRSRRTALLTYAAKTLHDRAPNAVGYLHAGSGQLPYDYVVPALEESGIRYLRGFAMNVSSHATTSSQEKYGDGLVTELKSAGVRGRRYVVDTSRNGVGPQPNPGARFASCNNPDAALGTRPTSSTTGRYADAYLWIKPPGESDGACHEGDPPSGWFGSLARELVANARAAGTVDYWPLPQ